MIFINLFANIAVSNMNRQPYIDALTKLITVENPDSSSTDYYSSNLSESITSDTDNFATMRSLNPTLFKGEESTFPLIDAIHMNNNAINIRTILRSGSPNTTFWHQYFGGNVKSNGWNQTSDDQRALLLAKALFGNQRLHYSRAYNRNNRREPNLYFSTLYDAFKHTSILSKRMSINTEAHSSLLNNQKNLCVVNRFKLDPPQTSNAHTSEGQFHTFQYLKDFILITLALKEAPDEQTSQVLEQLKDTIPDESLDAYRETRQTDNNTTFEGLDFDRITSILLAQTSAELNSQIATIDGSTVNTYIKQNRLGLFNGKEVFSFFSKAFFQKFLHISNQKSMHEDASESEILQNIICFDTASPINLQVAPSIGNHNNWSYGDGLNTDPAHSRAVIFPTQDSEIDFIPIGLGAGITFMHGAQDAYSIKLQEHIESLPQSRVVGLISNGFAKRTQKEQFEFISLTKKQSMIRKGFYIPTLFPIEYRDENFEIQKGYSFSLVCLSSTYDEMCNKARSREELLCLLSNYQTTDGLYFVDKARHLAAQKEIMQGLIEYSDFLIPSFKTLSAQNLNSLKATLRKRKRKAETFLNTIDANFFDYLSSEPNVNPIIKRKYNKVSTNYKRLSKLDTEKQGSATSASVEAQGQLSKIDLRLEQIEQLKQEIAKSEIEITKHLASLKEGFNSRVEISNTLILNQELYKSVTDRYQLACQKAEDDKDYISNGFFKNLLISNQVSIFELTLVNKNNSDDQIKYDQNFFNTNKDANFQAFDKDVYKFYNVKFLINSPSIISVDNGAKGTICGGPYVVSVARGSLHIALAYPSSIHGIGNDQIHVHPHASSISKSNFAAQDQEEYQWMSACLGEASALIYNAFDNNNLKTILLAALTWVKSANSTDVWGKRYKFFPKTNRINSKPNSSESCSADEEAINEDEIHDFLEEMIFEEPAQTEPEVAPPPPEQQQAQGFSPDQFAEPVTGYIPAYNRS